MRQPKLHKHAIHFLELPHRHCLLQRAELRLIAFLLGFCAQLPVKLELENRACQWEGTFTGRKPPSPSTVYELCCSAEGRLQPSRAAKRLFWAPQGASSAFRIVVTLSVLPARTC